MMTLDATQLSPALQALVDARLDTIERMLMGKVPRQDRLSIVREVESQIQEQLGNHHDGEPSREDVLTILATLDPPEAYLPEEGEPAPHIPRVASTERAVKGRGALSTGVGGGILGIVSLVGAIVLPALTVMFTVPSQSAAIFFGGSAVSVLVVFVMATIALVLSIRTGLRKPWAITGLVTSLFGGVLVALICVGCFLFL
jgi:hypothetical protein